MAGDECRIVLRGCYKLRYANVPAQIVALATALVLAVGIAWFGRQAPAAFRGERQSGELL
jgi:hypothetical protein